MKRVVLGCSVIMMMPRNAVAVLLATMIMFFVAADVVELENDGEISNTDESTPMQNIVKILYCTS